MSELLSSDEWLARLNIDRKSILDPDGWDRSNFEASWAEKITRDEFVNRVLKSTCTLTDWGMAGLWEDKP